MSSLLLADSTIHYPVSRYARSNLSSILKSHADTFFKYSDTHPWVLKNQNPLVQFLVNLSIDINQSDEYLFNEILSKVNGLASACRFTSIYNKGNNFNHIVFPEKNHETLIVVPFGHTTYYSQDYYFSCPLEELLPLQTLYTTDTRIRYATSKMTDIITYTQTQYSVVQLDALALAIGYIRYCRDRIKKERFIGLTPHSYIAQYPLTSFYLQHNEHVFINLLGEHTFTIDETKWSKMAMDTELDKYLIWLKETLEGTVFKSFNHFISQLCVTEEVSGKLKESIFPKVGMSYAFKQLEWAYLFGKMKWATLYLTLLKYVGREDKAFNHQLYSFFNYNFDTIRNMIPNVIWRSHFTNLYNDLKDVVKK